jgi:hypothetical protein
MPFRELFATGSGGIIPRGVSVISNASECVRDVFINVEKFLLIYPEDSPYMILLLAVSYQPGEIGSCKCLILNISILFVSLHGIEKLLTSPTIP